MPKLFVLAGCAVLFWSFHNSLKWRFLAGIIFSLLCLSFYHWLEPLGPGIIYGVIAMVIWFYSQPKN